MQKRNMVLSLIVVMALLLGLVMLQPLSAQDDLIPDMQTVQAGAQQLFTATAQASAYSTFSLTVESLFHDLQTATAAAEIAVTSTPTATATSEAAMTLTAQADRLTSTVTINETVTAFFAQVPPWAEEIGSELVRVDGGTFQMGTTPQEITDAVNQCVNDEGGNCQIAFGEDSVPQHSVTISAFQIERTEVTYRQYVIFLTALGSGSHSTGCNGQPCIITRSENENSSIDFTGSNYQFSGLLNDFPITNVTWFGADAYCRALGRRLPTEAEWERASRGYNNFIYPWGNEWNPAFAKTSISPDEAVGSLPVGSLAAGSSVYGAVDMAGNVAEWVSDWYNPSFYTNPLASGLNPTGPALGDQKVVRGGSWDAKPFFARGAHRQSADPIGGYLWVGFRCAQDMNIIAPTLPPQMTATANITRAPAIEATPTATPT